jgi:hypothetical protein
LPSDSRYYRKNLKSAGAARGLKKTYTSEVSRNDGSKDYAITIGANSSHTGNPLRMIKEYTLSAN